MNWQNYRFLKYKDLYVPASSMPRAKISIGGEVRIKKYNCMGQLNLDTGWLPNRIVDTGLDVIGGVSQHATSMRSKCYVGSSNTATSDSMVQLVAKLGTSVDVEYGFRNAWNTGAPDYAKVVQDGFRFAPGNGTGSIQEIGFHPDDEDKMFARHVISPAINKAADETLDVYHRFSIYPDLAAADQTGTATLDGEVFDWTCRMWNVAYTDWTFIRQVTNLPRHATSLGWRGYATTTPLQSNTETTLDWLIESGKTGQAAFVNIAASSGGDYGNSIDGDIGTYTPGSYSVDYFYLSGLDGGNLDVNYDGQGEGIRRIILGNYWIDLQVEFSRVTDSHRVPKDETKTMQVEWSMDWARRP